jgi:hypothetical protein
MANDDIWFICTKDFVCKKCGKSNSNTLPMKTHKASRELMKLALREQPLVCSDELCHEPFIMAVSDEYDVVEATPAEAAIFESNPKSRTM